MTESKTDRETKGTVLFDNRPLCWNIMLASQYYFDFAAFSYGSSTKSVFPV